ncbi:MAG: hypothetical protein A2052_08825 [Deltaproteobacteria bacterium GWA2_54_12]|nr:MAG: hypothetical protein A2052_08825 [Deltaproteobacteria bacterium GWA2_54_12]
MVIGVLRVTLVLHDSHSLKDKRQVLKSVIEKLRNRFNVSVAETGSNDLWQRAEIGIAAVGNDKAFVNSVLDHVLNFIEGMHLAEVTDSNIELLNF